MTQIQHVTQKEMTRRTGVTNALGYTFPDKDLILLHKDLKGKKKREVLDHETNHLARGEEGPFIDPGTAVALGSSVIGGIFGGKSDKKARQALERQNALARADLAPYRDFGAEQMAGLSEWQASPEGTWKPPTMEEVMASPGYETRLGAIENSAVARGGLLSGNALRDIGEFGASEYDRTYGRSQNEYQNELAKRMGFAGLGYGAAGGSAQLSNALGPQLANVYGREGQSRAGVAGDIAGFAGQYQGRQDWQDFLDKAYPSTGTVRNTR